MATVTATKIDIPLILGRLRPTSEYHWKGDGLGVYADIGEWRDKTTIPPTEKEVYDDWDRYVTEKAQKETADNALKDRIIVLAQSAVGIQMDQLTQAQIRALMAIVLWKAGAVAEDGSINPLADWVK